MGPIIHAMVVAVLRLVDNIQSRLAPHEADTILYAARNAVILTSLSDLSVQNLQALSIIAFNDVSDSIA